MTISNALTAICSLLFLMIGIDKFIEFMEPPCTMMNSISPILWKLFGLLQLFASILIWIPKFRRYVAGFFLIFMLAFTIYHLSHNTYDIGGAIFMSVILGFLVWSPKFIQGSS